MKIIGTSCCKCRIKFTLLHLPQKLWTWVASHAVRNHLFCALPQSEHTCKRTLFNTDFKTFHIRDFLNFPFKLRATIHNAHFHAGIGVSNRNGTQINMDPLLKALRPHIPPWQCCAGHIKIVKEHFIQRKSGKYVADLIGQKRVSFFYRGALFVLFALKPAHVQCYAQRLGQRPR